MARKYTTSRGRTYEFEFVRQSDNSFRPYIVQQPGYGSRSSDLHITHRLRDGNGYYVCFTAKLTTMQDAAAVAEAWAKRTDVYIDTGIWKH